jgi:gas vesicle protein GvpL/GvpF
MSAPASAATGVGRYVYGVVDAGAGPDDVETVTVGPLAALVSRVGLDELGEEAVRERLEDAAWLEQKVRGHEAVLEAALGAGAVVPFRFLTIYRDEDELRGFLAAHDGELRSTLDRVRGKVEIGVKAFVQPATLEREVAGRSSEVAELDAQIAGAQTGRAYLLRRQRDELARAESARLVADLARDAHARLLAAADDGVANPVQPRALSGRDEQMVLNGAYLVRADGDRLEQTLAALADRYAPLGIAFERTGPWPPYNFVPRDLGAGDGA